MKLVRLGRETLLDCRKLCCSEDMVLLYARLIIACYAAGYAGTFVPGVLYLTREREKENH